MAAVTKTEKAGESFLHIWNLTSADATGDAISVPGAADRSVQVTGTFGGSTITLQGSNEAVPSNWSTLHDVGGNNAAFTAAGILAIAENPLHIRPALSGGAAADVNVNLLSRAK